MSLAENLLKSIEVDETEFETQNETEEPHIIVSKSRKIIVPNELKAIAVVGDKEVETLTFDCVRYWDGNDLYQFAIYINYVLPNGGEFTYVPEKVWLDDVNSDIFHFDWVIKKEMTYYSGKLQVSILAIKTDADGMLEKQWGSFITNDFYIEKGLENLDVPNEEESKDVISQITSIIQGKPYLSEIEMSVESFSVGGTFKMIVIPSSDGEIDCRYSVTDENGLEILKFDINQNSNYPLEQEVTIESFDPDGCSQEYEFNKGNPKFYLAENYGTVLSVTQATGNSKSKAMSQDAVTRELNQLRADFGIESWEKIEPDIDEFAKGGTFKLVVEPSDDLIYCWLKIANTDGSTIAEFSIDGTYTEPQEQILNIEPFNSNEAHIEQELYVGTSLFYKLVEVKTIDVVQKTGASKEDVMSQGAVCKNFSNALKGSVDGDVVVINDISPVEHEMEVRVNGNDIEDLSISNVIRYGANLLDLRKFDFSSAVYDEESGVVTSNIINSYFCGCYSKNENVIDFFNTSIGKSLTLSVKETPKDAIISILLTGERSGGLTYYEHRSEDGSRKMTFTVPTDFTNGITIVEIRFNRKGYSFTDTTTKFSEFLLSYNENAEYEPYIAHKKYPIRADGKVYGVTSIYPTTTLTTDNGGITIHAEYSRDLNKAFEELKKAILG